VPLLLAGLLIVALVDKHGALPRYATISGHAFLREVECVLSESRTEEDIELLPLLLTATGGAPGRFVEIGANDGADSSQTLMLERCFNWTGLLIEAHPDTFSRLLTAHRTAKKIHAAGCAANTTLHMTGTTTGASGVSAATEIMSPEYKYKWRNYLSNNTSEVACRELGTMVAAEGWAEVDYLSLDTQGAEEVVLKTVDPSIFKVVMVEAERSTSMRKILAVQARLKQAGMRQLGAGLSIPPYTRGYNELYARPPVEDPRPSQAAGGSHFAAKRKAPNTEEARRAKLLEGFYALGVPRALHAATVAKLHHLQCTPAGRDKSHACKWAALGPLNARQQDAPYLDRADL